MGVRGKKIKIVFVTSSEFKKEENGVFREHCRLTDGMFVRDVFDFEIRSFQVPEILEVDIDLMAKHEVKNAYGQIKVPCIVEHAGLIFEDLSDKSYPGGLTKPMWDALGPQRFIEETKSANRPAIARAVVAYCDGMVVRAFVGETKGTISEAPRGQREFYWDTVFIPKEARGKARGKTYAEIVDDAQLGLKYKMTKLSQSARALLRFLEFRRTSEPSPLFGDYPF